MNLPNKLTLTRIILIPFFVVIPYINFFMEKEISIVDYNLRLANLLIVIIFIIASVTDFLDGYLARKHNLVTTFGKFMDPLADKLLVTAAMLLMIELNLIPAWVPIIILSREFMVSGIRLLAASDGKVIAASKLGKIKTVSQMIMIPVVFIINNPYSFFDIWVVDVLLYIAVFTTVISGLDYFIKNKNIIFESK